MRISGQTEEIPVTKRIGEMTGYKPEIKENV